MCLGLRVFSLVLFRVVWLSVCFGSLDLAGLICCLMFVVVFCLILYGVSCCSFGFVDYWWLVVLVYSLILLCAFGGYLCLVCVLGLIVS